ncbi:unnamed protein product [Phytomonas sp. EM1]|nr:unnamed protein product [Phytomonas sp. EM1]|eukprot:CCW65431.1 unnamed protein product [Phytomonas sp. isolate EM1]
MFYTYAEKQGNVLFDGWQLRQVAFDTMRRYLYYSTGTLREGQIAASSIEEAMGHGNSPTRPSPSSAAPSPPPPPPSHPDLCHGVRWRRKIKLDLISQSWKERDAPSIEDPHLRENDLFQVELQGEARHLQPGEAPAPWPLLCPSVGLDGSPGRCVLVNEEFVADPFFLRELYESLRDQFTNLRLERERTRMQTGRSPPSLFAHLQTIQSPRGKGEPLLFKGSRVSVVLRLRNEYEFRRFCYVVQSVLGYDKLNVRPHRGLAPFDPRNGITFAQIPMCVWHSFKSLDKTVFYTFLRGDLVGRTEGGQLFLFLTGVYICITHETVVIFREKGDISRWVRMQDVREFHYNTVAERPFFAFIPDPGGVTIVFIPQPPVYGANTIRLFNPQLETLRVRYVVREMCFSSLEIRRVIDIKESTAASAFDHVEQVEAETGAQLRFDGVCAHGTPPPACPMPKEHLATVWREVQSIYASRDLTLVSQSAIPIYGNNPNDTALSAAQVDALAARLARGRISAHDVVGISFDEARRVRPRARRRGCSQGTPLETSTTDPARTSSLGTISTSHFPLHSRGSSLETLHSDSHGGSSRSSLSDDEEGSQESYGVPGARYITLQELASGELSLPTQEILVDQHAILMLQSPKPPVAASPRREAPPLDVVQPITAKPPCLPSPCIRRGGKENKK